MGLVGLLPLIPLTKNGSNYSGRLATCGGSPRFGVDGGIGGLGPPIPPSTPNGLRSAVGAEESGPF